MCNATSLAPPFPSCAVKYDTEAEHNLGFVYGDYIDD